MIGLTITEAKRIELKTWLHTADRRNESGNAEPNVWQNRSRTYNDGNRNLQERFEKGEGFGNNRRNDTGDNGEQGSEQNGSGSNPQQSLLEEENHSAETQKFFNGVQSCKYRPQNELKLSKTLTARNIRPVYKAALLVRSNFDDRAKMRKMTDRCAAIE